MNAVFADAGYWIALFNPRDSLHKKAIDTSQKIQPQKIVTSQMVLAEFLNRYAAMGSQFRQRAVEVVNNLQRDSDVEIIPQTSEQFDRAFSLYSQLQDKEWSLADCASFLIMQELGIAKVSISNKRILLLYCIKISRFVTFRT